MTKNDKPLIYLAQSSKVLAKIISSSLEKLNYQVQIFTDGFSLLKSLLKESPNLIIADKNLEKIDGLELCSILKKGSSKADIPFILITSEDKVYDFWNDSYLANEALSITSQNLDLLLSQVEDLLKYKNLPINTFIQVEEEEKSKEIKVSEEEKLTGWLVNSMEKSSYYLNISQNLMKLYQDVRDLDMLVGNLFRLLYRACEYDMITLILDGQNAKVYKTGIEYFDQATIDEFWNICKTEYEQEAKKNHTIRYEEKSFIQIVNTFDQADSEISSKNDSKSQNKKLESYQAYTIKNGNEFVGTLHLTSRRKKIFNYKIQSSIDYILPSLANLLQEAVQRSELIEKESKIRKAFSKFVPEQVINDFLDSDGNSEAKNSNEKRNVVILMSDIRSFTSISEVNRPEDVVNFLNNYFTRMVDIVKKYGGTVDKFIGDAIMVLFGAPISYNDNAKRAVMAAIEMYAQLESIPCGQLKFPEGVKLDVGIGIHYGDVIVGQIGSTDKTSYTVIGDTVNLASRLEGLTKLYGAKIIISQAVNDELDDSMNILLLDSVKVKGKKESVLIYRADEKALPKKFTQAYEKGFKSYNEGAFTLAIPYFEKALEILPNDKAAKLMLERCNEFAINKPENWDGAVALTSK
ncbi:MAG: response regulator [Treponema sp.]|nr:response regulator [Treponema sp.]